MLSASFCLALMGEFCWIAKKISVKQNLHLGAGKYLKKMGCVAGAA
jgi:hypothetical protein